MEEKKSGDGEKGPRKKVSAVSATWGLKGGPLATAASPLAPRGLQAASKLTRDLGRMHLKATEVPGTLLIGIVCREC